MIQFDHVTFQYESAETPALSDISLQIEEGSFVAIVGHNGSGKSTLAKHVNGLLLPTSGTVTVCGLSTDSEENILKIRQQVGMAFQNPDNQLVTTIVEEDVAFGPENLGVDPIEIRKRVNEALNSVGMSSFSEKAVHHLSGGQKQRVAIAGILALKPRVVIFDEATAMLDPSGRNELLTTVKQLHNEGMTVLMVTQYMEETTECDRVIVMNRGKIVCDDTPDQVFSKVDLLAESKLVPPMIVSIRNELRELGCPIPDSVLKADQLAEAICQL